MAEPFRCEEDLTRLLPSPVSANLRYIFEPLDDLITDDYLAPYCWGAGRITFYPHFDHAHDHPIAETSHAWRPDQVVESGGAHWELLSAKCVHRDGQWCVRWLARRCKAGAPVPLPDSDPIVRARRRRADWERRQGPVGRGAMEGELKGG